jgi:hypothetical protein
MDIDCSAVACMLSAADRKDRVAWIHELNAAALRDYRRDGSRIELAYHPSAAARVRELVDREKECCPFLGFNVRDEKEVFILVIEAPEEASAAADALFAVGRAACVCGPV